VLLFKLKEVVILLELKNVKKVYFINNDNRVTALKNVNINFESNKFYGVFGHSGSGKSTLIQILGLLDDYDEGVYKIDNVDVGKLSEDEKNKMRMNKFGFVFQAFYLNPKISALENVMLPMIINDKIEKNQRKEIAQNLLERFGLSNKCDNKVSHLSGGEQQRVAIARALANNPDIIIADEPTGNLDKTNEKQVFDIFKDLVEKDKKTIIVVSHNEILKEYADKLYEMVDGKIVGEFKE